MAQIAVCASLPDYAPPAAADALAVRRLRLTDFRNYTLLRLELEPGPVLLTGENGAGKTNLLEAVSSLVPGRGLRGARVTELDRIGGGAWAVAARIDSGFGPVDIGVGRDPEGERRIARINGAAAGGVAELGEYMDAVWLTPRMDGLFRESASGRRRFLDRLICGFDPAHAGRLAACERAIRERAGLLRLGRRDETWLTALETQIAERSVAIAALRRDMVSRLNAACRKAQGPFPAAALDVEGPLETWLDEGPALEAETRCRTALRDARMEDAQSGGAAVGPHRSDLTALHLPRGLPAGLCSTGEQKALLVSVVLAHAALRSMEVGAAPVLLLDEIVAHLDNARREALFDRLLALKGQAWMTGTEGAAFAGIRAQAQHFHVRDGNVTPC